MPGIRKFISAGRRDLWEEVGQNRLRLSRIFHKKFNAYGVASSAARASGTTEPAAEDDFQPLDFRAAQTVTARNRDRGGSDDSAKMNSGGGNAALRAARAAASGGEGPPWTSLRRLLAPPNRQPSRPKHPNKTVRRINRKKHKSPLPGGDLGEGKNYKRGVNAARLHRSGAPNQTTT